MQRYSRALEGLFVFVVLQLFCVSLAFGQASRTWVSGVGDDANPCSRTAPCKTFAGAISKTATGGEIDALDPGGFGAVTITKSITIDGGGTFASILAAGTNGIIVNAAASAVVILRNLSINGAGTGLAGIKFLAGGALHIENCQTSGFTGDGIVFQPSGNSQLFMSNTSSRNNGGGGVLIKPTGAGFATAALDGVTANDNARGVRADINSVVSVKNSIATGNTFDGFIAVGGAGPVDITIENSVSSLNGGAGVETQQPSAIARISNVTVTRNQFGGLLRIGGGLIQSFGNNRVSGNTGNPDGTPSSTVPQI